MSETFLKLIGELNKSIVQLGSSDKLYEPDRIPMYDGSYRLNKNYKNVTFGGTPVRWIDQELFLSLSKELSMDLLLQRSNGVPQGAATSCSLSTLCVESVTCADPSLIIKWYTWMPGMDCCLTPYHENVTIMYADDGLVFSNSLSYINSTLKKLTLSGSAVSVEKSKFIKWDGKWTDSLIFLGVKFDPFLNQISAHCRDYPGRRPGSRLVFSKSKEFLNYLLSKRSMINFSYSRGWLVEKVSLSMDEFLLNGLITYLKTGNPITNLFNTRYTGTFLSRLYNGSFNYFIKKNASALSYYRGSWLEVCLPSFMFSSVRNDSLLIKHLINEYLWLVFEFRESVSNKSWFSVDVLSKENRWYLNMLEFDVIWSIKRSIKNKVNYSLLSDSSISNGFVSQFGLNYQLVFELSQESISALRSISLTLHLLQLIHSLGSSGTYSYLRSCQIASQSRLEHSTWSILIERLNYISINLANCSSYACVSLVSSGGKLRHPLESNKKLIKQLKAGTNELSGLKVKMRYYFVASNSAPKTLKSEQNRSKGSVKFGVRKSLRNELNSLKLRVVSRYIERKIKELKH